MRKHFPKVVFIIVTLLVAVIPSWGAALTSNLEGGDTLSVTCAGEQLDETVVNVTRRDLTCVPSTSTTTSTTTTAPPSGNFTDTFANLNNWTFAHFAYEATPPRATDPSTATVVGGQARIDAHDQNYGDAALRSAVKYDLTNGGVVTLDMTDNGGGNPLVGFANVSFSANSDDAKSSMADERAEAYAPAHLPADALQIQLRDNCRVPWAPPVVVRYLTSAPGGRIVQRGNCAAAPDGHWRFVFTASHVSIRNGANAEVVGYDVTVPPTGWFILGVHNHASVKYGGGASVVGLFDNVTYPTSGGPPPSTSSTTTTVPPTTSTTTTTTLPGTTTTAPGTGVLYSNTFDTAADMGRMRFQKIGNTSNQSFNGDHNTACGDPFTYRPLNDIDPLSSLVYWCNGHFMSAVDTTSYIVIAMTPTNSSGQTIIFPATANRFCWFQDMAEHGGRKWIEAFVISDDRYNANGGNLGYWSPIFNDNSVSSSILLTGDDFMFQNQEVQYFVGQTNTYSDFTDNAHSFTDKASRFQQCLVDNGNGTVTFSGGLPNGSTFTRTGPGSFPAGPRVFILSDVSYDPVKDGRTKVAEPHTMHWDNITVTSGTAVPAVTPA